MKTQLMTKEESATFGMTKPIKDDEHFNCAVGHAAGEWDGGGVMTAPKLDAKPEAQEVAILFMEARKAAGSPLFSSHCIANASPDLRRRLAAAIYPEGAKDKQFIDRLPKMGRFISEIDHG